MNTEIITVVTIDERMVENYEDINVEETVQTPKISHSEGLKAVEAILQYFEQGASVMDLRFLYHKAAKHRVRYGGQHDITHFFLKKSAI
ncbi:hypothetical protein TNCV_1931871 [Trichonephila clavipes]|nr:hypothetical protein TNCV_1931871 [Trichonephila clavipes]